MSAEDAQEIESKLLEELERIKKLATAVWYFLVGAFILGGWVATLEYRERHNTATNKEQTAILSEIKDWMIETTANRWTIRDHQEWQARHREQENEFATQVAKQNELQELRLQRLEDTQGRILTTLDKIDKTLGTIGR